jgi:L-rhamnose mutarotase
MQKMGFIIGLKKEKVSEYKALHSAVWPEVLAMIRLCNIANYSIFLKEPENILFAYFEYHGTDYAHDMKKMADDAKTQAWWSICGPCQEPYSTRKAGEWWASMEQVFFVD